MTPEARTDSDFAFGSLGNPIEASAATTASPPPADPLGPLALLEGTWVGHGFNAIWRPHHPSSPQDRFLELNLTDETLVFTRINGNIPNRGLAMHDINMHGLTYMQQIAESSDGTGLHIESGGIAQQRDQVRVHELQASGPTAVGLGILKAGRLRCLG